MIAQIEWALRMRDPFTTEKVKDLKTKWKTAGLELKFENGLGLVANFEGRPIEMAWLSMDDFARYQFKKKCDELLHRDVGELAGIDRGYLNSLFYLMEQTTQDRRILFGSGAQFDYMMDFLGDNNGLYFDLSNLASGMWAMTGNHRNSEILERAFMDSLEIKVTSRHH